MLPVPCAISHVFVYSPTLHACLGMCCQWYWGCWACICHSALAQAESFPASYNQIKSNQRHTPTNACYSVGVLWAPVGASSVPAVWVLPAAAGEAGTEECLPDLATCLADPDLVDAATGSMWKIFMRHPNSEVQVRRERRLIAPHGAAGVGDEVFFLFAGKTKYPPSHIDIGLQNPCSALAVVCQVHGSIH